MLFSHCTFDQINDDQLMQESSSQNKRMPLAIIADEIYPIVMVDNSQINEDRLTTDFYLMK